MVAGLVSAYLRVRSVGLRQGLLFEPHVRLQIHGGGLDRLVTQPQGYDGTVDAVVEQIHGQGMAEYVWRDMFGRQ